MNTLLVAINAKYEHEGLAVWYLKAACRNRGIPAAVRQYSINDSAERIWSSIYEQHPDVIAFSCYIWNREQILKLISDLKKAKPGCVIIAGGPEVSYEGSEKDFTGEGADFVIKGEGEGKLPPLLLALNEGGLEAAHRLYGDGTSMEDETAGYSSPFDSEYLGRIKDRIAYIESSRGCPYRCSYCLSSESRGCVYFPLAQVEADIGALVAAGARVIKFVDRSFNVNERHSLEIWNFIRRFSDAPVTFHFEINPDRLTHAQMENLMSMPAGLVQIEAGIQSVNTRTLKEVSRTMDIDAAIKNLKLLAGKANIHVHTDLIAGLPYEDLESFKESFNRVYEIGAHHLQLGFLKLIHGTRIRREARNHGYKFRDYPPYEVIENKYITSDELLRLKEVEEVLDRTWNSGRFKFTLEYLVKFFPSPFSLYEEFAGYLKERGKLFLPISAAGLFAVLREFALGTEGIDALSVDSLIALDYACSLRTVVLPDFMGNSKVKVLDSKALLAPILDGGWGKECRKRFLILSGSFPLKNDEDSEAIRNRMVVDMEQTDPVTGRAVPGAFPDPSGAFRGPF